jgi:hypothetical protein
MVYGYIRHHHRRLPVRVYCCQHSFYGSCLQLSEQFARELHVRHHVRHHARIFPRSAPWFGYWPSRHQSPFRFPCCFVDRDVHRLLGGANLCQRSDVGRCGPGHIWLAFRDSRALCHLRICLVERESFGDTSTSTFKLVFKDMYECIRSCRIGH